MTDILNKNIVLVLNRNWQAINIRTPADAFCQMATNVATALEIEVEDTTAPLHAQGKQTVAEMIEELKKGRIELKMDKQGIIHTVFGKIGFGSAKLKDNLEALMVAVKEAQPSGIKGIYINSVSVAPTMGPGIKVQF